MRRFLMYCLMLCASALPAAQAEDFPSRPLRLIVPYTAGGALDNIARILAEGLGKNLGRSVVVENRPGGNNLIATRALQSSDPDGYTLMLTTNGTMSIAPVLYANTPYDPLTDFSHIGLVSSYPYILVSKAGAFADFATVLKKAAADPESISMAYTGHVKSLSVDWLGVLTKSKILKVPYKGDNDAISDLAGGRVDIAMIGPSVVMPLVQEKKLDALAVTSNKRLPALAQVPTVAESVTGFNVDVWTGLVSNRKVPEARLEILRNALTRTLEDRDFQARLSQTGDTVLIGAGPKFRQRISDDLALWRNVMKEANISPITQ
ncbi:Bug family tripartite tricarboxylate transporter substrate binding protein [Bordetella genomosp. 13]|uniref:Bug family tripartite tricarboxylate transporter substrate binding protein n=1 Tax=Bordetella genomosp. 13 TaxID=463040 RepID=UPI001642A23C|nr:tripartite tricarboxylate transporter substrate binding protein [Bordetella genomosp. 13]